MNLYPHARILVVFSIFLLGSCQQRVVQDETLAASICDDLNGMVDSVFNSNLGAKGIMVNVIYGDETACTAIAGLAKEGTTLTANHPILIASNTKTYMATAMMVCIENGLIELDEAIKCYLRDSTVAYMNRAGYDLAKITVKQLMSHTSGIYDYVDDPIFFELAENDPKHQWTRAEQIGLAMQHEPLDTAGGTFEYADTNYLLLGEIMENLTGKPFYQAVRELIDYEKLDFDHTWFVDLEETPADLPERAQQFYTAYKVNSYDLSPTFDLYGGGGIATTISEMSSFYHKLFNGEILSRSGSLDMMKMEIPTPDTKSSHYHFGLSSAETAAHKYYGHGGFWGTTSRHFPELNITISVCILEKDYGQLRGEIIESIIRNQSD